MTTNTKTLLEIDPDQFDSLAKRVEKNGSVGFSYPSPFEIPESVHIRFDPKTGQYEFEFDYPDNESMAHVAWCSDPSVETYVGANSRRIQKIVTKQYGLNNHLAARIATAINTEDCFDREPKMNRSVVKKLIPLILKRAIQFSQEKQTDCDGQSTT